MTAPVHVAARPSLADQPYRLAATTLYRLVMGIDAEPSVMPPGDVQQLGDPLAALFRAGRFPLTTHDLLAELDAARVLPDQRSYLVGEAGQLPPDTPGLHRDLRFVVTRADGSRTDLLVSADARDEHGFLQVAAWDEPGGRFNYYMRIDPTWVWAGDSNHALAPGTRGVGCFDSHVNGSVVMKELKEPWLHWQSMKATILLDADDPLRANPLYARLSGAEDLEATVRAGVARWTAARLARAVRAGAVPNADWLLRQLCTTTTINLASTDVESGVLASPDVTLRPPLGLWLNADALLDVLGIPAEFEPPAMPGPLYANCVARHGFALVEGDFRHPGDTFFAFAVPEASVEDTEVVRQMVAAGLLTARFAACVLMVDFPNPVYSPRRARLLAHLPCAATLDPAGGGLSDQLATAIVAAAKGRPADGPEAELAANWALAENEWRGRFAARIQAYMAAVGARASTAAGCDDYVRLAESRRREFRAMRLNEFALTLPVTSIPPDAPLLAMDEAAAVRPK